MTKKEKEAQRLEAIEALKKMLQPGKRVYTQLEHVSSTGMSRRIRVYIPVKSEHEPDGMSIRDISYWTAHAIGARWNSDRGSIVVGGCGMDMGYHVVYSLASTLWGRRSNGGGFECIGEHCPSNDHANGDISREDGAAQHYTHSDGGYALTHSWL